MILVPNQQIETDEDEFVISVSVVVRNQDLAFHTLECFNRVAAGLVFDGADRAHIHIVRASEFDDDDE